MKLSYETVKGIAAGAVRVEESADGIRFFRFTKEQEEYYKEVSERDERKFCDRCLASAGIRLMFKTDSKTLGLKGYVEKRTSRNYYSFDIFVNGKELGNIDNFSGCELPTDYTEFELPVGEFSGEFSLPEGTNEICIYFPWSVQPTLREISLDDRALVEAVRREKKLLAFGDSITQGYDALRPSMRYASRVADSLCAEEINKGIGGEFFAPELASLKESFKPDYITVAYGTNDWSKKDEEDFKVRCRSFFETLSLLYPEAEIFAITPIWRGDYLGERLFGPFENLEKDIKDGVSGLNNVFLISGFDLVPHDEKYFADLRLHPNDDGFDFYFNNLIKEIKGRLI